ncbi:MAG: DUF4838 domain-containing protein [Clostridia bacterium]|nr:DUF4838 domain-containing protein [Clostridia bacterium]
MRFFRYAACLFVLSSFVLSAGCGTDVPPVTDTEPQKTETETKAATVSDTIAETEEETEMKWEGAHVKRLTIAGDDISEFSIYSPMCETDKTVKNACADLIRYVEEATGVELQTSHDPRDHEICVGPSDRDTKKVSDACDTLVNNGEAIIYDNGRLYLTGKTATGTMYAVYSFLEDHVGCGFYSSKFTYIKYASHIDVPADTYHVHSPKLINRDTYWFDTFDPAYAAKLKINGAVNRDFNGYGESVSYAGPFVHSLPALAGTSSKPNDQPCLTDPAIYEKVLKNVKKYLKENPRAKIVSVSQNDSYPDGLGCRCENCRKIDEEEGTPMGSLLTFVNRIAGAIKDEYPDVYVDTLAYRYTRKAPKNIKPADNVIIRLCSIECCFSHPLNSDCEANKAFTEDIEAWSKICDNLFIWDYTTDFMYYVNPFPNLYVLYDNVRYFTDHNVIGLFEQGNYQAVSGEFGELRAYLLAKLLWDPDMSRERYFEYMDEFLQGYYGDGWTYIREYIDKICTGAANNDMGIYNDAVTVLGLKKMKVTERAAYLKELGALWDKALEAADEEHYGNVEKSSCQIRYAALCVKWTASSSKELEKLHKLMLKYDIGYFREGVKTPQEVDYGKKLSQW